MLVLIARESGFEAAHRLDEMPPGHKCRRLHGHSYRLRVELAGEPDPKTGIYLDFGDLDAIVSSQVLEFLDHNFLNDVIPNPTLENIARWIWERMKQALPKQATLRRVAIWEGPRSYVEYSGGNGW